MYTFFILISIFIVYIAKVKKIKIILVIIQSIIFILLLMYEFHIVSNGFKPTIKYIENRSKEYLENRYDGIFESYVSIGSFKNYTKLSDVLKYDSGYYRIIAYAHIKDGIILDEAPHKKLYALYNGIPRESKISEMLDRENGKVRFRIYNLEYDDFFANYWINHINYSVRPKIEEIFNIEYFDHINTIKLTEISEGGYSNDYEDYRTIPPYKIFKERLTLKGEIYFVLRLYTIGLSAYDKKDEIVELCKFIYDKRDEYILDGFDIEHLNSNNNYHKLRVSYDDIERIALEKDRSVSIRLLTDILDKSL